MSYLFIVFLSAEVIGCLFANKKYQDFLEFVDKESYPLKNTLLPLGLLLFDLYLHHLTLLFTKKAYGHLLELYEEKAGYYLKIHWANKIGYFFLGLGILSLFGLSAEKVDEVFIFFSLSLLGVLFFLPEYEIFQRIKKRHLEIRLDFPDFLNKLILLVNAGMPVSRAWEKIALNTAKDTALVREINRVVLEIKGGKPETQAYEAFARRCRMPEVTRFISVILQNLKKGNAEMVVILRLQANECWGMRKHAAKRLGEEASTKLLFPMMLMFIAILLIVATPAIIALKNI